MIAVIVECVGQHILTNVLKNLADKTVSQEKKAKLQLN